MVIKYLHSFLVEFEGLDRAVQKQLRRKLDELHRSDTQSYPHQALKGEQFRGLYKLRAGDWRLIYQIVNDELLFITLGHRADVYDKKRR
jgi:addiction module RelE/StbE family toxin